MGTRAKWIGLGIAIAAGLLIGTLDLARPIGQQLVDAGFRILRGTPLAPGTPGIVVVGIDERTVEALPEPVALWHGHLAALLRGAADAGALLVGLDMVLPDRSYGPIAPDLDRELVGGILRMRQAGGAVLAITVDAGGRPRSIHAPLAAAAGPGATGYALWRVDPDGVVRGFDEQLGIDGVAVPTFAGQIARALGARPQAGGINYALGNGFDVVPLVTVLGWIRDGDSRSLVDALRGKVVLVGSVLPFSDRVRTPVPLARASSVSDGEPGVLVHAQTLRTLLDGRTVLVPPAWLAGVLAGLAGFAWLTGARPTTATVTIATVAAGALTLGLYGLSRDIQGPVAAVIASATLAAGARLAFEAAYAWRERVRLRGVFAGYVSPQVMTEIEAGRLEGLASARRFLAVLMMDVRGFTTRSERESPERVVAMLNALCEQATAAIHGRGGTVDKFMGDGVLAFFGAPGPMDEPCAPAFDAGVDILERVRRMSETAEAAGEVSIAVGVGLSCGEATVGHVGAVTRHAYTAIGDCVNVAARLESLSKDVGYPLVMSQAVASRLAGRTGITPLGSHAIKGHSTLEVYGWRPT